jgi:hypothetical protein
MGQRSKEFLEDVYWIAFAAVILLLAVSLIQLGAQL